LQITRRLERANGRPKENVMGIVDYKKAKQFIEAVEDFRAAVAYDARAHVGDRDCLTQEDAADPVIALVRELGGVFFDSKFDVASVLAPLQMTEGLALAAERFDDQWLAGNYRECASRIKVHVARQLVEAAIGESTALERTLKASIKKAEKKPSADVVVPISGRSL
jgi:hypothetical protein